MFITMAFLTGARGLGTMLEGQAMRLPGSHGAGTGFHFHENGASGSKVALIQIWACQVNLLQ